jgi:hypothetical protein
MKATDASNNTMQEENKEKKQKPVEEKNKKTPEKYMAQIATLQTEIKTMKNNIKTAKNFQTLPEYQNKKDQDDLAKAIENTQKELNTKINKLLKLQSLK